MKILLIQIKPFGDVFISSALADVLQKQDSSNEIHFCCQRKFQKILRNHPAIKQFHLIDHTRGWKGIMEIIHLGTKLHKEHFDLAIDIQNKPYTTFLAAISSSVSIGWNNARLAFLMTHKAKRKNFSYHALRRLDLLSPLEIDSRKFEYYLDIDPRSNTRMTDWLQENSIKDDQYILCSPGSPVAWKQWDLKLYAEVLDMVVKKLGLKVVLLWGPGEQKTIKEVGGYMKEKHIPAPPTDFFEAGALMQKARLLLCNDGGINHIATATGVKTLAIFGKTDPRAWSPSSVFSSHHHINNPQWIEKDDNSFGLSSIEVFNKISAMISSD